MDAQIDLTALFLFSHCKAQREFIVAYLKDFNIKFYINLANRMRIDRETSALF